MIIQCLDFRVNGLKVCAKCPHAFKKGCTGGEALVMDIHKLGDSVYSGLRAEYYFKNFANPSFYDFVAWAKKEHVMTYGLKKYETIIRIQKIIYDEVSESHTKNLDKSYPFKEFYPNSEVINKAGYHQALRCECKNTTNKGSYRDVILKTTGGLTLYYYHQHCIKADTPEGVFISSCGFRTKTTLERLNMYLRGVCGISYIYQKKYKWFITLNHGDKDKDLPFFDGMRIDTLGGVN